MTKPEFDAIRVFVERLPVLRIQLSDGPLLDRCQTALQELIEQLRDNFEEHPQTEDVAKPAPHYPEPAHIEDVPKDEPESGSIKDVPQEDDEEPPPPVHRPERIMPVEPETKKKTHRKRVHHR